MEQEQRGGHERRKKRRATIRVGWYASAPRPSIRGIQIDSFAPDQAGDGAQVLVFDGPTYRQMALERRTALVQPVLVIAAPDELKDVLPVLRDDDDACLPAEPAELLQHRLERLGARRARVSDPLTGLAHRWRLRERLSQLLPTASEAHEISVVLTDIDLFKTINDRHGHLVGDAILAQLGDLLRAAAPNADIIARYSGEQFVVLLGAGERQAIALAERIRKRVKGMSFPEQLHMTVSVGVATADSFAEPSTFLSQAQEALYAAKAAGRDRVTSYNELERRAWDTQEDVALASFENLTRVVSERIAMMINQRGRQLFQQIRHEADIDVLTSLYTRRYLERRLGHDFTVAAGQGQALTIALIDIDYFGEINKRHGWPSGDRVLADLAKLAKSSVRGEDWVARYGGEEFFLVMPGTPLEESLGVLERLRELVAEHRFESSAGQPLSLTISIGAAERRDMDEGLPSLIERTSSRLLAAKRGGRNRVCS